MNHQPGISACKNNKLFRPLMKLIIEGRLFCTLALAKSSKINLIAVLGNKRLKEVAQQLDVTPSYASQYRRRAIARHLVRPGSYGHVQYILPFFNEFIRATQDTE